MAKRCEHSKRISWLYDHRNLDRRLRAQHIVWRYAHSLNTQALWFAIPMVIAETYVSSTCCSLS